ncbi:MAG: TPM domain-containing protein [bacterium]
MNQVRPKTLCLLLLLGCLLCGRAWAWSIPDRPAGYVNDYVGLLSAGQKKDLEEILDAFARAKGHQVFVAVVPDSQGQTLEELGIQIAGRWKPGQAGQDDGVIFLVVPSERKARIEVGYGLEGILPDALAKRVLEEQVIPSFAAGKAAEGIRQGSIAILNILVGPQNPPAPNKGPTPSELKGLLIVLGVLGGFLLLVVLLGGEMTIQSGGKTVYHRKFSGRYADLTLNILQVVVAGLTLGRGGGGIRGGGGKFGGGGASGTW